jgi:hypothetical protein
MSGIDLLIAGMGMDDIDVSLLRRHMRAGHAKYL